MTDLRCMEGRRPVTCRHVACDVDPYCHGVCKSHYERTMRRARQRWGEPCSVPGCPVAARSRGWCGMHYERWRQHGTVAAPQRVDAGPDLSAVREQALALRDHDPSAARMLVDQALRGAA